MKIHNDVTHALHSTDKVSPTKTGANTATPAATTSTPVDSVSISDTSRALTSVGGTDAPFDTHRVQAIKAAISAGHFKVNPEAIADKVISSASQLLTGKA